jgi:D-serine deaminase-like pyridoxal phosphate-dependent protein
VQADGQQPPDRREQQIGVGADAAAEDDELAVGDTLVCGISHPCTAFDKWPQIALVDDDDVVIGDVRTHF